MSNNLENRENLGSSIDIFFSNGVKKEIRKIREIAERILFWTTKPFAYCFVTESDLQN